MFEEKYLSQFQDLRNFKRVNKDLYNCSCPVCGDSTKNKRKARGFFIKKDRDFYFYCHNCHCSLTFKEFLKQLYPHFYREYIADNFRNSKNSVDIPIKNKKSEPKLCKEICNAVSLTKINPMSDIMQYIRHRKIPNSVKHLLYWTEDFKSVVDSLNKDSDKEYNLEKDDPRLVIPFFNSDGEIIALQGRSLNRFKPRYITIKFIDSAAIYGLDRVKWNEDIIVVEGPLDSLFLPNAIAVANSDLERVYKIYPECDKFILVYDNEPKNKEICAIINKAIDNHRKVCIWKNAKYGKDINEMVMNGQKPADIYNDILQNSYVGIKAGLEFRQYKKC